MIVGDLAAKSALENLSKRKQYNHKIVFVDADSGEVLAGVKYHVKFESGKTSVGSSDKTGHSKLLQSEHPEEIIIELGTHSFENGQEE